MKMLSPIASIARGSVAGDTFTANQFAQIIVRARTAPVQPGTVNQTKIRAAFTAANTAWHALAAGPRQGWIDYADSLTYSGPLGTYKVPGRQVFLSNYGLARYLKDRAIMSAVPTTSPPTNPGFIGFEDLNISTPPSAGVGYKITGTNPNPETIRVFIYNSRAFDLSRLRYKGPWITSTVFSAAVNAAAAFSIDVTGCIASSRYFCAIRAISVDDPHRITPLFYLKIEATDSGYFYILAHPRNDIIS